MSNVSELEAQAKLFREDFARLRAAVETVIVGQSRVIECTITAILCGGNVLLEGVPGLGKTELVKTLARALDLDFKRIQFTPDLMPADIVGTTVMTSDGAGGHRLEFRAGPVFTQLLLADEINRATPKTQSALLECMQESAVTVAGETRRLGPPFFVLATQNPIEHEGTYELPEAQLDRFLFKVVVPYLGRKDLNEMLARTMLRERQHVTPVLDGPRLMAMREILARVVVADPLRDYAVRLVLGTHPDSDQAAPGVVRYVRWGASPRAAQAMIAAARVHALAEGRAHVAFTDLRYFAPEVLQHRVVLNYDGQAEKVNVAVLLEELVSHTKEQA